MLPTVLCYKQSYQVGESHINIFDAIHKYCMKLFIWDLLHSTEMKHVLKHYQKSQHFLTQPCKDPPILKRYNSKSSQTLSCLQFFFFFFLKISQEITIFLVVPMGLNINKPIRALLSRAK